MDYEVVLTLQEELLGTASANPEVYREFIQSKRPPEQVEAFRTRRDKFGQKPIVETPQDRLHADELRRSLSQARMEAVRAVTEGDDEAANLPTVDEELQKGTTVFHRSADGKPLLYDYQIKGFFKDACAALRRADNTVSAVLSRKKAKKDDDGGGILTAYKRVIDGIVFVTPRQIVAELPVGGKIGECVRPLRAQTAQGERVSLARSETLPAGTVLRFTVSLLSAKLEDALYEWLEHGRLRGLGQWRNSGKGRFLAEIKKVKVEKVDR